MSKEYVIICSTHVQVDPNTPTKPEKYNTAKQPSKIKPK